MTKDILTEAVGPDLAAKMRVSQAATTEPCPTCGVGAGRWCEHRTVAWARKVLAAHPENEIAAEIVRFADDR